MGVFFPWKGAFLKFFFSEVHYDPCNSLEQAMHWGFFQSTENSNS